MFKKSAVKQNSRASLNSKTVPVEMLSQVSGGYSGGGVVFPPSPPLPIGQCPNPDFGK